MSIIDARPFAREKRWLALLALMGLVTRVWLAATTPGSTDVKRWRHWAALAEEGSYRQIYEDERPIWNHPAPVLVLLKVVSRVSAVTGLPFRFALRLVPSLADVANVLLVYALVRRRRPGKALLAAATYALSPVAIVTSGLHGNTDCMMTFLLLGGVYLFSVAPRAAAALLGAALCVKYPAALALVCLFVAFARELKSAAVFALLAGGPFLALTLHFAGGFPEVAVRKIAEYGSEPGTWGLAHVRVLLESASLGAPGDLLKRGLDTALGSGRAIILVGAVGAALVNRWRGTLDACGQMTLAFAIFFVFAPGFAVQYMVWLLPFFIVELPAPALVFNVFVSWFVVNAFRIGWRDGEGMVLPNMTVTAPALVAWGACIVLLVHLLRRLGSPKPAIEAP